MADFNELLKPYSASGLTVHFEGTLLLNLGSAMLASQVATALNGAYNMGRMSAALTLLNKEG